MSLQQQHDFWYWGAFLLALLIFAVLESVHPWRQLTNARRLRWKKHTLLFAFIAVLIGIVFRTSPMLVAVIEARRGAGVLSQPGIPFAIRCVVGLLAIDFVRYVVHRAHHRLSFLWRFHWAHHSDPDIDVTTSLRIHPVESLLVRGSILAVVSLLAVPPLAVLLADALAPVLGLFHHANIVVPKKLQEVLRWLLMTPEAHRIHHSDEMDDQSSNYGVLFPWWDYAFGTYRLRSARGSPSDIGLKGFQNVKSLNMKFLLLHPLSRMHRPTLD
jgi:sterol desaturase/sphingolipid hydroxylase (fatty acid hydroxylase superfamily)